MLTIGAYITLRPLFCSDTGVELDDLGNRSGWITGFSGDEVIVHVQGTHDEVYVSRRRIRV